MKFFMIFCAIFSLFLESNAMVPINKKDNTLLVSSEAKVRNLKQPITKQISIEVPIFVVQIFSNPPIEIIKLAAPYNRLIVDRFFVSPVLSVTSGSFYKDIEIKSPLFLLATMDDVSFAQNIISAFRPNKCVHFSDVIPQNSLETKFSCLTKRR